NGGNLAIFGGNTCWWRVHLVEDYSAMVCDRDGSDLWYAKTGADWPENSLTGVSYRNGGGAWLGQREDLGYRIQYPSHWVFRGTGLATGQVFGQGGGAHRGHLVGYECDGALATKRGSYLVPTATDGTPENFVILGWAPLLDPRWRLMPDQVSGMATMGVFDNGLGTVFNAATTDWSRLLRYGEPVVDRVTRNVIDRLAPHADRPGVGPSTKVGLHSGKC